MKLFWKITALAAGLALFSWYLSGIGLRAVLSNILSLGAWAPIILIPYFIVYIIDCLAWMQTLPARQYRFPALLRIRWAGESVNNILPTAYVGGEAVKVYLLRKEGVSATEGATSAVISKTAQTVGQVAFILIAAIIFYFLAQNQPGLQKGLLFIALCSLLTLAALFWIQKMGIFRMVLALANVFRLRVRSLEAKKEKLLEVDETIVGFYKTHPRRFYASTSLYFTGWMLDTVEIYLVSHLFGMPISWNQAIVVEAFTGVAKALGMWVPGSLGIQESGIVLIGRLVGLPDTLTAAYAVIRRARELVFVAIGMLLLYAGNSGWKSAQAHAPIR